ncbi:DUF445 domain-containing protein [Sediminibacillus massiliensis]|uniref:DUF445 domain-containing protein n=1 Tax=Sediminibacillus massiliensis TaxID=1926277 RepID=UPI00098835E1|nr:DUF445 family protein [Sediminibacillus massiliensis]
MEILIVVMMIVIGAVIGGLTNSLAIKMLFRPYQPKFIGKWKVPFTPGLIPKRRDELARQLGKMVVDHLLTPKGIRKKLQQPAFQSQLTGWAQKEMEEVLKNESELRHLLDSFGIEVEEQKIRAKIADWTELQYKQFMEVNGGRHVREFLPSDWLNRAESGMDKLSGHVQDQIVEYLWSEAARRKIGEIVEKYLDGKGFFGNMISSFLGNEGLSEKIQPLMVQYVQSAEAKDVIRQLLVNEWNKFADKPLNELEAKIGRNEISTALGKITSNTIPVDKWLKKTVREITHPFQKEILESLVPNAVGKLTSTLADKMETLMDSLHLAEIVEKEVEGFPVERIEQLVLDISRREFKMITYLGALLGGVIGFVQGLIVLIIG